MEIVVSRLLKEFEEGRLTRRQLVQSLAMAAAAVALPGRAAAAPAGFRAVEVDHISYQATDYRRTRDFYAELLGMRVEAEPGPDTASLTFGDRGARMIIRNRRTPPPPGAEVRSVVDHVAFKIEGWDTDAVEAELKRRGHSPRLDTGPADGPPYASFHVKDPDGWDVQISGDMRPGDRLYRR